MSVSNMNISVLPEHFPLNWKVDVMHLLQANLSVEPFLLLLYSGSLIEPHFHCESRAR